MSKQADFTFAGQSIAETLAEQDIEFKIMDIDGDGLLGSDIQAAERSGTDGDRLVDEHLPSRTITISYHLQVANEASHEALVDRADVEQLLNGVLRRGRGLQQLVFTHRDGYFLARFRDAPKPVRLAHILQGELSFYCPQPFLYVDQEHTVEPAQHDNRLSIESNHYVEPVILWELDDDVGAAWIEVDGERLTIDTGISEGQQIRIDAGRKEARVGGVLNVENIHGTYPRLYDGSHVRRFPGGDISFTYQERWI